MIKFLKKLTKYIPDELYLKMKYYKVFKKKLNLRNPQTFNEKLQWLKLHDRKDVYTTMVDKFEAKKYVANIIGEEYIIPTFGVYNTFDDIDFNKLPNQFVMKCTHDSGGIIIVKDKSKIDLKKAKSQMNECLKSNFYYFSREWPYKNVQPKIIIEEYMEDKNNKDMIDFKVFTFNGNPEIMYVSTGLENHEIAQMSFFDMNYNVLDCKRKDYKLLDQIPNKPLNFEKMKDFSKILSKNIPHVRVDWYEINNKLYFSELTFSTNGGYIPFEDIEWDYKLGKMIDLSKVKK